MQMFGGGISPDDLTRRVASKIVLSKTGDVIVDGSRRDIRTDEEGAKVRRISKEIADHQVPRVGHAA